jgi:hypothetical protein
MFGAPRAPSRKGLLVGFLAKKWAYDASGVESEVRLKKIYGLKKYILDDFFRVYVRVALRL